MKENLLQSQFESLEEPAQALVLDSSMSLPDMIDAILMKYPVLKGFRNHGTKSTDS